MQGLSKRAVQVSRYRGQVLIAHQDLLFNTDWSWAPGRGFSAWRKSQQSFHGGSAWLGKLERTEENYALLCWCCFGF